VANNRLKISLLREIWTNRRKMKSG